MARKPVALLHTDEFEINAFYTCIESYCYDKDNDDEFPMIIGETYQCIQLPEDNHDEMAVLMGPVKVSWQNRDDYVSRLGILVDDDFAMNFALLSRKDPCKHKFIKVEKFVSGCRPQKKTICKFCSTEKT